MITWGILKFPIFYLRHYFHGLKSTILMIDADSLLTKTTISTALAFKGNQASALGYFAKVLLTSIFELYCSNFSRALLHKGLKDNATLIELNSSDNLGMRSA